MSGKCQWTGLDACYGSPDQVNSMDESQRMAQIKKSKRIAGFLPLLFVSHCFGEYLWGKYWFQVRKRQSQLHSDFKRTNQARTELQLAKNIWHEGFLVFHDERIKGRRREAGVWDNIKPTNRQNRRERHLGESLWHQTGAEFRCRLYCLPVVEEGTSWTLESFGLRISVIIIALSGET